MRIGIDLGGTKIEGIALDENGDVIIRQRIATPVRNYKSTLESIVNLVLMLENKSGGKATIGIGTPGSISPKSRLLRNSNSICMNGQPVKEDLENLLGRDIRMSNDANCFALSEATDGAAKGARVVFGVIVGTGTGSGIVVNGQVLTGPNAIAGEWGHNPLPWPENNEHPGSDCFCGKKGCIETYLSGPGLVDDYKRLTKRQKSSKEIVLLAESNDEQAKKCMADYENRMARALASVVNMLDPDIIVLGGGMSNIKRLYTNVPGIWGQYIFSDVVKTRLVPPAFGDSSGVRGAAWLWNS